MRKRGSVTRRFTSSVCFDLRVTGRRNPIRSSPIWQASWARNYRIGPLGPEVADRAATGAAVAASPIDIGEIAAWAGEDPERLQASVRSRVEMAS